VSAYVCDHVDLECKRKHVRMQTGFRELGGLGGALGLLKDGLQRLQGVLDGDDGCVVDGVSHCGGVEEEVVWWWIDRGTG